MLRRCRNILKGRLAMMRRPGILDAGQDFLARHAPALPEAIREETALDLMAVARGMIDTAPPAPGLEARVVQALRAYLAARITPPA